MSREVDMLVRCRTLRRESAQRAQARAARGLERSRAEQQRRETDSARENHRQGEEANLMVQRLITHELPPLAVGLLQIDHQYRRRIHTGRITEAVRRVDVATQRLDGAKLQTLACERSLDRADHLGHEFAKIESREAATVQELVDDDFTATWSHQRALR
jgi:hypothetical protein